MIRFTVYILIFCVFGCSASREMQPLNLDPPENKVSADELDFALVNEKIFKPSCVGCHSEAAGNSGGVNLESYESVFEHVPQIKMEVTGGMMPPKSELSEKQTRLLADWIDAGALERAGDPVSAPPPTPTSPPPTPPPAPEVVTFSTVREKVLKTNCIGCHSEAAGNMGDVNLETYPSVFEKRTVLLEVVGEGRMPPKKKTPLTVEQKRLFLLWLNQGAKP